MPPLPSRALTPSSTSWGTWRSAGRRSRRRSSFTGAAGPQVPQHLPEVALADESDGLTPADALQRLTSLTRLQRVGPPQSRPVLLVEVFDGEPVADDQQCGGAGDPRRRRRPAVCRK